MGQIYHCLACDYQGSFVIEEDMVPGTENED